MLKKILKASDCAECRFCCSFRRKSLWETPVFSKENKEALEKKYPEARFKKTGINSFTVDLIHLYKTDDSEEEAACPFLSSTGCVLNEKEKPFDCSIWPLRVCRKDGEYKIMLENVCPAVNKLPEEKITELVINDGLGKKIIDYAKNNEDALKEFNSDYKIIM